MIKINKTVLLQNTDSLYNTMCKIARGKNAEITTVYLNTLTNRPDTAQRFFVPICLFKIWAFIPSDAAKKYIPDKVSYRLRGTWELDNFKIASETLNTTAKLLEDKKFKVDKSDRTVYAKRSDIDYELTHCNYFDCGDKSYGENDKWIDLRYGAKPINSNKEQDKTSFTADLENIMDIIEAASNACLKTSNINAFGKAFVVPHVEVGYIPNCQRPYCSTTASPASFKHI